MNDWPTLSCQKCFSFSDIPYNRYSVQSAWFLSQGAWPVDNSRDKFLLFGMLWLTDYAWILSSAHYGSQFRCVSSGTRFVPSVVKIRLLPRHIGWYALVFLDHYLQIFLKAFLDLFGCIVDMPRCIVGTPCIELGSVHRYRSKLRTLIIRTGHSTIINH